MDSTKDEKVPVPPPPVNTNPLYVPLNFWMDVIAYMDKRIEMVSTGSGFGTLQMTVKLHKGKIHEVTFGEQIRVRDIVEKSGAAGTPNPQQLSSNDSDPVSETE